LQKFSLGSNQRFDQSCTGFFSSVSRFFVHNTRQSQVFKAEESEVFKIEAEFALRTTAVRGSRLPGRAVCRQTRSKPAASACAAIACTTACGTRQQAARARGVQAQAKQAGGLREQWCASARRAGARSKPAACACAAIARTAACALGRRPPRARRGRAGARPGPTATACATASPSAASARTMACPLGRQPAQARRGCAGARRGRRLARAWWCVGALPSVGSSGPVSSAVVGHGDSPPDELLQAESRWRRAPI
jgi:hypothetical protein